MRPLPASRRAPRQRRPRWCAGSSTRRPASGLYRRCGCCAGSKGASGFTGRFSVVLRDAHPVRRPTRKRLKTSENIVTSALSCTASGIELRGSRDDHAGMRGDSTPSRECVGSRAINSSPRAIGRRTTGKYRDHWRCALIRLLAGEPCSSSPTGRAQGARDHEIS